MLKAHCFLCKSHLLKPILYLLGIFTEVPAVVVGVVGMGHVPGIEKNWDKELNIHEIMRYVCVFLGLSNLLPCLLHFIVTCLTWYLSCSVAPPSRFGWVLRNVLKGALLGVLGYACYRAGGFVGRAFLSLPNAAQMLGNIRPPPAWPRSSSET